jgi:hypothetical protein
MLNALVKNENVIRDRILSLSARRSLETSMAPTMRPIMEARIPQDYQEKYNQYVRKPINVQGSAMRRPKKPIDEE